MATVKRGKPGAPPLSPRTRRPLLLPVLFLGVLAAFTLLPRIGGHPTLLSSFTAASAALGAWWAVLWLGGAKRRFGIEIALRPQHYLQAVAHAAIFIYWSFYWAPIRDAAPLIVAQIVFAYAFDMLLAWSRRDTYTLGFGPFPIIFSTNLFLRFRDEWFYWQFAMVAVGFLAKELIRWNREGRKVHVFNPSSFPLALASLILIATGTTDMTWGEDIATTLFQPPQIFLFIFLVALPGQYLFGVSTMTLSAVLTTYVFGLGYFAATGTYFFIDDYIPIAVFLGMHLLFTDPSTSPRSELGRIIFGVMYGLSVVGLYSLLAWMGAPTFYDKLLQVPLMNLMVRAIDRAARSNPMRWLDPARLGTALRPMQRNLVYTSLWVIVFGGMTYAQGVGDHHPGHSVQFWENACRENRYKACDTLTSIETTLCARGSGWACNEVGIRTNEARAFNRACNMGFSAGCSNRAISPPQAPQRADPNYSDYAILLRRGKGVLPSMPPAQTFDMACSKRWAGGCGSLAALYLRGDGVQVDKPRAAALFQKACEGGSAQACADLGLMHKLGDGIPRDDGKALGLLKRACDLNLSNACRWLAEETRR